MKRADFVDLGNFKLRVYDRHPGALDLVACAKVVLRLSPFSDRDQELLLLIAEGALKAEVVTEVGVSPLVKRAGAEDSWLDA